MLGLVWRRRTPNYILIRQSPHNPKWQKFQYGESWRLGALKPEWPKDSYSSRLSKIGHTFQRLHPYIHFQGLPVGGARLQLAKLRGLNGQERVLSPCTKFDYNNSKRCRDVTSFPVYQLCRRTWLVMVAERFWTRIKLILFLRGLVWKPCILKVVLIGQSMRPLFYFTFDAIQDGRRSNRAETDIKGCVGISMVHGIQVPQMSWWLDGGLKVVVVFYTLHSPYYS